MTWTRRVADVTRDLARVWMKDAGTRLGAGGGRGQVRLHTLTLIRWVAVIGQLFTVLLVHHSLDIDLPLLPMLAAIALSAAINLGITLWFPATARVGERGAALLIGYDTVQLCVLLGLSGGLQNPFAVLLLVPVTLTATTLGARATITLCVLVILGITLLALWSLPLPLGEEGLVLPGLYRFALWTALVLATVLIAAYGWRMSEESRLMSDALAATQIALAREQQLSALGGLAAAAAHELGSPLATITITANELARALPPDSPFAEDVTELLDQTRRCRDILATLGRPRRIDEHERFTRAPLSVQLEAIAAEFARRPDVAVEVRVCPSSAGSRQPDLVLTPDLRHALANFIDNALQFARMKVTITVAPGADEIRVLIEDDGPGFAPDVLDWLGEPYLSTRRASGGLGLGVFIATTLLARAGIRVQFDNGTRGARVTLSWPRAALLSASLGGGSYGGRDGRSG